MQNSIGWIDNTWRNNQIAKRKRQRAERLRRFFEKAIIVTILSLALCGLIAIIMSCFGHKVNRQAEAAAAPVIEQPVEVVKEELPSESVKEPAVPSDNQIIKTLKSVCRANGMADDKNNEVCWQTLWAMSYQESKLGHLMTGDQGRSRGWFHIQLKMHSVSDDCATDLNCSANWTLKRLIGKGFPVKWTYSVQSHNGFGTPAAQRGEYAQKISRLMDDIKQ